MSLATRCPSCETVFRVVQDQLKVSDGWVRCGQCGNVFSAFEGLFDLDRDMLPERQAASAPADEARLEVGSAPKVEEVADSLAEPASKPPAAGEAPLASAPPVPPARPDDDDRINDDRIDEHLFGKPHPTTDKGQAVHVDARDRLDFSDARFDSDLFAESTASPDDGAAKGAAGRDGQAPLESATAQPGFMRRADRRGPTRGAPSRRALLGWCVIGGAALVFQLAFYSRDALASQWPSTLPALSALCRVAGCTISAPRRIDEVSVESTALTRSTGRDAFVFSAVLRNRGKTALAMPSVELSLTDGDGRLVARRALSPGDFGAAARLPPGAEAALDVSLGTGSLRVAGYTAEVFYP